MKVKYTYIKYKAYPMSFTDLIKLLIEIEREEGVHYILLYYFFEIEAKNKDFKRFSESYISVIPTKIKYYRHSMCKFH